MIDVLGKNASAQLRACLKDGQATIQLSDDLLEVVVTVDGTTEVFRVSLWWLLETMMSNTADHFYPEDNARMFIELPGVTIEVLKPSESDDEEANID